MRISRISGVFFFSLLIFGACSSDDSNGNDGEENRQISVYNAQVVVSPVPNRPAAAYFEITGGSTDAILVAVESSAAQHIELHETTKNNGIAMMRPVESLTIKANTTTLFERGGKHAMLFGITQTQEKETLPLVLIFDDGTRVEAKARIIPLGSGA